MKLIWHNFALFMFCYILIAIIYSKLLLNQGYETSRKQFELLCIYCSRFRILIPIHFLVGFYVSEVIKRYWDQFLTLPYPDRLALKLVSYVPGKVSLHILIKIEKNTKKSHFWQLFELLRQKISFQFILCYFGHFGRKTKDKKNVFWRENCIFF